MDTPMVLISDSGEDGDFKDGGGYDEDDKKILGHSSNHDLYGQIVSVCCKICTIFDKG